MTEYRASNHLLRAALPFLSVLAVGFGAGLVNGLLGTGGGILLLLILRRVCRDRDSKDAFAASLLCILPLSVLSVCLYLKNGLLPKEALLSPGILPFLLGAVPGGICGAYLLDRLKLSVTELIFAALLLFSGWRMLFS